MGTRDRANFFITNHRIKLIGKSKYRLLYKVGKHEVAIIQKAGRKIITCSCTSHSLFPTEPTICSHKIAAIILYFFGENFKKIINLLITWRLADEKH